VYRRPVTGTGDAERDGDTDEEQSGKRATLQNPIVHKKMRTRARVRVCVDVNKFNIFRNLIEV
jgi:hypothetical protein